MIRKQWLLVVTLAFTANVHSGNKMIDFQFDSKKCVLDQMMGDEYDVKGVRDKYLPDTCRIEIPKAIFEKHFQFCFLTGYLTSSKHSCTHHNRHSDVYTFDAVGGELGRHCSFGCLLTQEQYEKREKSR